MRKETKQITISRNGKETTLTITFEYRGDYNPKFKEIVKEVPMYDLKTYRNEYPPYIIKSIKDNDGNTFKCTAEERKQILNKYIESK